jgi:exosortase/archaeosortase family protein
MGRHSGQTSSCTLPANDASNPVVPRPWWVLAGVFALVLVLLQWGWGAARGGMIERMVINDATVKPAVLLINTWTPEARAIAVGASIKAQGGGINVLNGCEGTEVLFLLIAALVAYPISWRFRALGMLTGTFLVYLLNQMRLLALFYSYRSDRALFDQLHGLVAPLMLIALSIAFLITMIRWDARIRLSNHSRSVEACT